MSKPIPSLKSIAFTALIFASGGFAGQLFQPAFAKNEAESSKPIPALVSDKDGSVWLWNGISLYHCQHELNANRIENDGCYYVK